MANTNVKQGDLIDVVLAQGLISSAEATYLRSKFRSESDQARELISRKLTSWSQLGQALAVAHNLPFVRLQGKTLSGEILSIIPFELASSYQIIAYELQENILKLALSRPFLLSPSFNSQIQAIATRKNLQVELSVTTQDDIDWALKIYQTKVPNSGVEPKHTPLKFSNLPNIDLTSKTIPLSVLSKFPEDIAARYRMIVFDSPDPTEIHVAIDDPSDKKVREILDFVEDRNDINIKLFQASPGSIDAALRLYHPPDTPDKVNPLELDKSGIDSKSSVSHEPADSNPSNIPSNIGDSKQSQSSIVGQKSINLASIVNQSKISVDNAPQPSNVDNSASAAQAATVEQPSNIQVGVPGSEKSEKDLDSFLGKPIKTTDDLVEVIKTGFVPRIVAAILSLAINSGASDVHLEPTKVDFRLRLRIDGELQEVVVMPQNLHPPVSSRIKILSDMLIDEQRIPQDGRYDAVASSHEFDVRVSTLPTVFGEKVVMRLLDKSQAIKSLEELGFEGVNLKRLTAEMTKPFGTIMATGPTGSGKSTTLYAIINTISNPKVNVITLEDPVEYEIKGVNQVQVKPKIGFTFAEGLRSVLRQDPNVIMVGEVRDKETASLVTHAALTGHLVLTTLHTNDAAGALPRLINMGVEPFLITTATNAIIAQRLVRRLCSDCPIVAKVPEQVMQEVKNSLAGIDVPSLTFKSAGPGCAKCHNGFKGRLGIYEVLTMTETVEQAILNHEPASKIGELAVKEGMVSMRQDGLLKAARGLTTIEEVFKSTAED